MFREFFKTFRKKIILKKIEKLNRFRRKKEFCYIDNNQKIGVLLHSENDIVEKHISDFISFLKKNNKVELLKFTTQKPKKKEILPDDTFSVSTNKYSLATNLKKFVDADFDILIVISNVEIMELHHVIVMTNAALKVSPHYTEFNFADLTFILENKTNCEKYLHAIKQYLLKDTAFMVG